jgi:hypothetical protein
MITCLNWKKRRKPKGRKSAEKLGVSKGWISRLVKELRANKKFTSCSPLYYGGRSPCLRTVDMWQLFSFTLIYFIFYFVITTMGEFKGLSIS